MRLVVWNCNMGLHAKVDKLLSLRPDIAILPECASPEVVRKKAPLFRPKHYEWLPSTALHKGLGVISFGDYTLRRHDQADPGLRYILPLHVDGPASFRLLATWAFNNSANIKRADPGPLLKALDHYRDFLSGGPAIVAGDFNNHFRFDKPRRACNHANALVAMDQLGLFSAYHHVRGESPGEEQTPTFYWYRDQAQPYHLDYCFLSTSYKPQVRQLQVGEPDDWLQYSDHMPLVIDIDTAAEQASQQTADWALSRENQPIGG